MEHLHAIEVKVLTPTAHKGTRVKLSSQSFDDSRVTLPYDYEMGDVLKQAEKHLIETDMQPVSYCYLGNGVYIVMCEEFEPLLK
jgi:hypothetical protein